MLKFQMKESLKQELLEACQLYASQIGPNETGVDGFRVMYRITKGEKRSFNNAYLALVLQGQKRTYLGEQEYVYGSCDCVVTCMDLPSQTIIEEASPDKPFISAVLSLDRELLRELAHQLDSENLYKKTDSVEVSAMMVAQCDDELGENVLRLLRLGQKSKAEISLLQGSIKKEIHARLILGKQGDWVRKICSFGARSNQVSRAVQIIKESFKEELKIDELAKEVNLSPASLHRHFKQLTGYSPIQFQKSLKLYEAKRLLSVGKKSVSSVAFEVGYVSPSQFSRDYKSFFSVNPGDDARIGA